MKNIFDLPANLPHEELFEVLLTQSNLKIERIISIGQTTAPGSWYDQEQAEWVILLQGEACIAYEGGSSDVLRSGDYLLIPPHQKHRVDYTSSEPPCIWLAVHFQDESQD